MRVAVFDYKIVPNNPVGSCHLRMIQGLCQEHEFTVFAVEFANPCPERIRFVRVPVPTRPLVLLFLAYHLVAPLVFLLHRWRTGARFDVLQMVESNLGFGHVAYVHFCHRAYLKNRWREVRPPGLRGLLRFLDHWLHALAEPWVFRRAKHLVVPSQGLRRELEATYAFVRGKITVIPNPVDLDRMRRPGEFDREGFRREKGAQAGDLVLVFVALGHFERKGLGLVLGALVQLHDPRVRLWVVGGEADLVAAWERRTAELGLGHQVRFFGMQKDVRPFLWGADAFVLPSVYETSSLVSLEAAAAGLPLVVTPLYGVEEFMRDGETGFVVARSAKDLAAAISCLLSIKTEGRNQLGLAARLAVVPYGLGAFARRWQEFYGALG